MDDTQRQRMAALVGKDRTSIPTLKLPELIYNGNTGEFRIKVKSEDGDVMTPVKSPVEITILRIRSILSKFKTKKNFYFSTEIDSPNQTISWKHFQDGKVSTEEVGTASEFRAKDELRKTQCIVYCLVDGKPHRFTVKGSSLKALWNYQAEVEKSGKLICEVKTVITTEEKENDANGGSYYTMVFAAKPSKESMDKVEEELIALSDALLRRDQFESGAMAGAPIKTEANDFDF